MKEFNEFKKLKFHSVLPQDILQAVSLLEKLGYEVVRNDFSADDAAKHNGVCAWDDGEITEGWLDAYSGFKQVTLEDLREMVGNDEMVLWLNKNTLEEKYLKAGNTIRGIDWVKVPDGATFATGDKDNFVFRKDGWYYEDGVWVATELTFDKVGNYSQLKLFWVKSDVKDNVFTLERLLGCEVLFENRYQSSKGYITSFDNSCSVTLNCGGIIKLPNMSRLTFFTEDGDELTFDEYVKLYYPCA